MERNDLNNTKICVVGLGYVGLPLFCLLSSNYRCVGLDQDVHRVALLNQGYDDRHCVEDLKIISALSNSIITSSWGDIKDCHIFIVTVPTPVDIDRRPDTSALEDVCENLSSLLKKDDIVIFESTVFPGATEELCLPILEDGSGLKLGEFSLGYSPERVNVGDNFHQLVNTPKIISASDNKSLEVICKLYRSVIDAAIIKASSIKVAEAAKMYENVQRDVLIGLANEYSEFCRNIGISIHEVTSCASTKWNFSKVLPGLVGGHCIGVDTYYLLEKAKRLGQDLSVVRTAREINESKSRKVFERMKSALLERNLNPADADILILGFSYKKDTSDIRNTKIASIIMMMREYAKSVVCYDPLVDSRAVKEMYNIDVQTDISTLSKEYKIIFKLVEHSVFEDMELLNVVDISSLL